MKSRLENVCIPHTKAITLTVPLTTHQRQALDALKAKGIQKGHWVAQAIREKLERDGLIEKEEA